MTPSPIRRDSRDGKRAQRTSVERGFNVALEHDTVDILLAIGSLASPVAGGILVFFVNRIVSRRDSSHEELAKQGDRLNCHTNEIRNIHRVSKIEPFNPNWDR